LRTARSTRQLFLAARFAESRDHFLFLDARLRVAALAQILFLGTVAIMPG